MQIKLQSFIFYALITIVSCNLNSQDFQSKDSNDLKNFENFFVSVDFSAQGFKDFVVNIYNVPTYGQTFLPNNFVHLEEFLRYGSNSHQPLMYGQRVVRLFSDKLKSASYVNAGAFSALLHQMPHLLESFFAKPKKGGIHLLQENINTLLYTNFSNKFSLFKENPELFLESLSQDIVHALSENQTPANADISVEELRKTVIGFLETGLSKLIWNPQDELGTWQQVKTIAHQLAALEDHDIIADMDDLNSLYITLVERYCYFVDVVSLDLPVSFYADIKRDILREKELCLFTLEEQDELIQPKKERLMDVIASSERYAHDCAAKELALVA